MRLYQNKPTTGGDNFYSDRFLDMMKIFMTKIEQPGTFVKVYILRRQRMIIKIPKIQMKPSQAPAGYRDELNESSMKYILKIPV